MLELKLGAKRVTGEINFQQNTVTIKYYALGGLVTTRTVQLDPMKPFETFALVEMLKTARIYINVYKASGIAVRVNGKDTDGIRQN